ncbi:HAD family hydrolase [Kitasatospora sp. NPDC058115]|uniref:HAD family hydrolase n=1 Tax=Kitasatospora sp. NPDC058115 TaxID=3346347 RepID=UPI0036DCA8CB
MIATPQQLADVMRPVKHVLLDFDGPVCSVFAGLPASEVAQRLHTGILAADEEARFEGAVQDDPLALYRLIAETRPELAVVADKALTVLETEAVLTGKSNPGGESVLRACMRSGRSVSVVSNNAALAIETYLAKKRLRRYVAGVFGRVSGDPASMKPSPRLLLEAIEAAKAKPEECIFIGDAVRDVEAGYAAGVATVGYANKPGKETKLITAGAVAVVTSMHEIAAVLE